MKSVDAPCTITPHYTPSLTHPCVGWEFLNEDVNTKSGTLTTMKFCITRVLEELENAKTTAIIVAKFGTMTSNTYTNNKGNLTGGYSGQ